MVKTTSDLAIARIDTARRKKCLIFGPLPHWMLHRLKKKTNRSAYKLNMNPSIWNLLYPQIRFQEVPKLLPNQVPLLQTWYSVPLRFVPNRRGNDSLLFQGQKYSFCRRRGRDDTTSWRCTVRNCPVNVTTRGRDQLRIESQAGHNHTGAGNTPMKTAEVLGLMRQTYDGSFINAPVLLDHEEPTPELWYTVPLHIVENERGNRNLCFRGNFYNMPRGTREGTVWHCSTPNAPFLHDWEIPQTSQWYTVPTLQYAQNSRGRPCVMFRGHRYRFQTRTASFLAYWRCFKEKCMASLCTRGNHWAKLGPQPHRHARVTNDISQKTNAGDSDTVNDPDNPPLLMEGQEPIPKTWYTAPLRIFQNKRGTTNLNFRGYIYFKGRPGRNDTCSWTCSRFKCRSKLVTHQPTVLESNQVPKPSTWYYVELQYAKNSNGSILLFRGYRYDRQKLFPDAVISWKCSERDCPAMVFTLGENCLKIKSHAHNHACLGNKAMVFSKKVSQLAPQYQNVQPALQAPSKPPPLLHDHQTPMPSIWYTVPLKFFRNKVSKLSVRFHGHEYNMEKKTRSGDTVTWICPKPACSSFIITRGKDQVWLCPRPHNHAPSVFRALRVKQSDQKLADGGQAQKASGPPVLQPDEIPQVGRWYTVKLEYTKNRQGFRCITFRGHRYNCETVKANDAFSWRCYKTKCMALLNTQRDDRLMVGPHAHTHPRFGSHQKTHERDVDGETVDPENPPPLPDDQEPSFRTWYTVPLRFFESKRGKRNLSFRGYGFHVSRTARLAGTIGWTCSRQGCTCRVITRGVDKLWYGPNNHNHGGPRNKRSRSGGEGDAGPEAEPSILQADQIPVPRTWYKADLQYTTTRGGDRCFVFRGHRYNLVSENTWRCAEQTCPALMYTRAVNEIRVGRHGHNHPRRGNYQRIHEQDFDTVVVNPGNSPLLYDNLAPKPEVWYTTPVPMHTTQKYISFRGFSYRVEKTISKHNTVAWVCPNPTCESRIITRGYNQIWFDSIEHSHAASKRSVEAASVRKPLGQPKGGNARKSAVKDSTSKKGKSVSFVEDATTHEETQTNPDPDVRITRSSEAKKRKTTSPKSNTQAEQVSSTIARRNSAIPKSLSKESASNGSPQHAVPSQTRRRSSIHSSATDKDNPLMVWLPNASESTPQLPKAQEESIEIE
ncbi:hypothetical protein pipiens_005958 [Culex pipiens pipiens]|uniref:FLYWCH-type domain-containing protein n=1 Tax=Culex pipiens pipiens TaxID=38569 RepID=A0ABD1DSU8_CULPP